MSIGSAIGVFALTALLSAQAAGPQKSLWDGAFTNEQDDLGAFPVSSFVSQAQGATRTVWSRVYSADQARVGAALFADNCASCHRDDLSGGGDANGDAPALAGPDFMNDHEGATLDSLFAFIKANMPAGNAGRLRDEEYASIIAYLLESNGFPAGDQPLAAAVDGMRSIRIEPEGGLGAPPNRSLVQVVACLVQRDGTWFATRASAPIRARVAMDAVAEPLGTGELRLLDPPARPMAGSKMLVTGILIRNDAGDRLNVTALRDVGAGC